MEDIEFFWNQIKDEADKSGMFGNDILNGSVNDENLDAHWWMETSMLARNALYASRFGDLCSFNGKEDGTWQGNFR